MINVNYLRSGMVNTLNMKVIHPKKDRLIEYLKLSQGFSNAYDYALHKNYLKNK